MTRGPDPSLPVGAPAIDVEAGVERLMGNREFYLRALARFRHDYRHAGSALRAALDAGDVAGAQRLAHTLKGAAGMIEAGALRACALGVENALRSGEGDIDILLLHIDGALSHVMHQLDGMLPAPQDPPQAPAPGVPDALARLRAMLDIGDGAAVELAAAARTELAAELGEREYARLYEAVTAFDYERALELLDRLGAAGS